MLNLQYVFDRLASADILSTSTGIAFHSDVEASKAVKRRQGGFVEPAVLSSNKDEKELKQQAEKWKRILLLVIAITVHNIPGN